MQKEKDSKMDKMIARAYQDGSFARGVHRERETE